MEQTNPLKIEVGMKDPKDQQKFEELSALLNKNCAIKRLVELENELAEIKSNQLEKQVMPTLRGNLDLLTDEMKANPIESLVSDANGEQWQKCPKCNGQGIVPRKTG